MLDPCCEMMGVYGRDHYPGVPESDLPDAFVEVRPGSSGAVMYGRNDISIWIYFCPWCGTSLGTPPDNFPKWELDPDEQPVEDTAFRDTSLGALGKYDLFTGCVLAPAEVYRSPDGTLTCRISGTEPEFGVIGRFVRRQMPSGEIIESVIIGQ